MIYKGFRGVTKIRYVTSKKSIQIAQKISARARINSIVLCTVPKIVAARVPSVIIHVIYGTDAYIASKNEKRCL